MNRLRVPPLLFCALWLTATGQLSPAQAGPLGPSPYLSFADSPFNGGGYSYFYLEDFEDGLLNTPGVTANPGTFVAGPGGITDSVDSDDGSIDGSGTNGRSYFSGLGTTGPITFTFNSVALGGVLPTDVGIVWTDGLNNIRFEAFDSLNNSLGVLTGSHADSNFVGGTAEDRFYGFTSAGGISKIMIESAIGGSPSGTEVDHLQYGHFVPEPTALTLAALGLAAGLLARRRAPTRRLR